MHAVLPHPKAAVDPFPGLLCLKRIQVSPLADVVGPFVDPLAACLILVPEAVIRFAAKGDDAVPLPFVFEEPRCALVEGTVCRGVIAGKPG